MKTDMMERHDTPNSRSTAGANGREVVSAGMGGSGVLGDGGAQPACDPAGGARGKFRDAFREVAQDAGGRVRGEAEAEAQEDETILFFGLSGQAKYRFVYLDPPGLIRSWKITGFD